MNPIYTNEKAKPKIQKPKRRLMQGQTACACRRFPSPFRHLKIYKQSLCSLETSCGLGILIIPDNAGFKGADEILSHIEIVVNRKERERSVSSAVLA